LPPRQLEQEQLKEKKKRSERGDRECDAPGRVGHLVDQGFAHDSTIPMSRMAMIGPIEPRPTRPKPSDNADRPASTDPSPIANASMTGPDRTPVVTLPAS